MKLQDLTWPDIESADRNAVVLIPTGSLEQHGRHLPLFTDSLIVTAVAEEVEKRLPSEVILAPTLWLGASGHHLAFPGSLSASFETFIGAIVDTVESLVPHGFTKFYVLNGHGGNTDPIGVALRKLKSNHLNLVFVKSGYYEFAATTIAECLQGPLKEMAHACEAETSLVLHLKPSLVKVDKLKDDGLMASPQIRGVIHHFDQMTEDGSYGYATLANAEKGKRIFESAVQGLTDDMHSLFAGYVLQGLPEK